MMSQGMKSQEEKDYAEAEAEQDEIDRQQNDWGGEEMVPVPVDEAILGQLLEMGFSDVKGRKSIVHGKNLEGGWDDSILGQSGYANSLSSGALAWLSEHQDDPDIDQPYMVATALYTALYIT